MQKILIFKYHSSAFYKHFIIRPVTAYRRYRFLQLDICGRLCHRVVVPARQATYPMPESTISPSLGLWIWQLGSKRFSCMEKIAYFHATTCPTSLWEETLTLLWPTLLEIKQKYKNRGNLENLKILKKFSLNLTISRTAREGSNAINT